MNFPTNRPNPERLRKVWYCCWLSFTPALTSKAGSQYLIDLDKGQVRIEQVETSREYLGVVGAPPLRFLEPFQPFDPATQPPAAPPPKAMPEAKGPANPAGAAAPSAAADPAAKPAAIVTEVHSGGQSVTDPTQPSIIPDEMRPRVRAEEFLPFFQLPSSGVPAAPAPDTPETLPPSSATYRQK